MPPSLSSPLPLSSPVERELNHTREIEISAYKRADGLWDIEAHLTDVRETAFLELDRRRGPGEPIHDMWLRLTIDGELTVRAAEAAMPTGAYDHCHLVTPNFSALRGLTIGRGWNKQIRERLGGTAGCTHLVELLAQLASTALQAVWNERAESGQGHGEPGDLIDSCHAYAADGPLVAKRWPERYTGAQAMGERGAGDAAK